MKKFTIAILAVLAVGILAFGFTGEAFASQSDPAYPGNGGMGGNGGNGGSGGRGSNGTGTGIPLETNLNLEVSLDDVMAEMIASELGISVDELQAREAAGETLVEIGLSLGFDTDTILAIHDQARIDALAQAVADGLISQEDADWLLSRMDNGQYGTSSGLCDGDCTFSTMTQTSTKYQNGDTRGSRWGNN